MIKIDFADWCLLITLIIVIIVNMYLYNVIGY